MGTQEMSKCWKLWEVGVKILLRISAGIFAARSMITVVIPLYPQSEAEYSSHSVDAPSTAINIPSLTIRFIQQWMQT